MKTHSPALRLAKSRRGLTLLELVMVVSILAVLTAMVVPGMNAQHEETRAAVARKSMQDLRDTITNRYLTDMNELPQANDGDSLRGSTTVPPQLQLHFLFVNPNQYVSTANPQYTSVKDYNTTTQLGWNGPYVGTTPAKYPTGTERRFPKDPNDSRTWADCGFTTAYGLANDMTLNDPWGSPYVIAYLTYSRGVNTVIAEYLVSAGPNRVLNTSTWARNTDGSLNTQDDLALLIREQ